MANLNFSSPVYSPPQEDTVKEVELTYIEKPLIPDTQISKPSTKVRRLTNVEIIGESKDQCVIWVRNETGNTKVHGYAGNLQPEGDEPRIGAVALERSVGHVSLVKDILPDGKLVLEDANYEHGYITKRVVDQSTQRGYIY